jgi:spermidine synthase
VLQGRASEAAKRRSASHDHFERGPDMTLRVRLAAALLLALAAECAFARPAEKEETIFTKVTPYSTIIVRESKGGLRTLWFGGSKYPDSAVKIGDPDHIEFEYTQAMTAGLALAGEPKRVLSVGLGGGMLPNFLRKHYPEMVIDAVDIDPDVVDVAKKFFGFREDATMHAYAEDGRRFIEECKVPYDIIFLDAYGAEEIPYHMATKEFLQAVRRATAPKGVVVSNILRAPDNRLHDDMVRTYQEVFDSVYIVATTYNEIVLAMPANTPLVRASFAQRASQFSNDQKLEFDIGSYIRSGFREPAPKPPAARILLDKDKKPSPPK